MLEAQLKSEAKTWPTQHEHDSSPSNPSTLCLCKTDQHGSSPEKGYKEVFAKCVSILIQPYTNF